VAGFSVPARAYLRLVQALFWHDPPFAIRAEHAPLVQYLPAPH
jgi:hypothetical protein